MKVNFVENFFERGPRGYANPKMKEVNGLKYSNPWFNTFG